jgi:hypothetical protein
MKIEGSGSGSISQRHVSPDPDPRQNVMDPQNWWSAHKKIKHKNVTRIEKFLKLEFFWF